MSSPTPPKQAPQPIPNMRELRRDTLPLPNYTLSSVCPQCGDKTFKLACKIRCGRCGFMWDCSEL